LVLKSAFLVRLFLIILNLSRSKPSFYVVRDLGELLDYIYRNKIYIRWKWTLDRFTLPISTLDRKAVSTTGLMKNRAER
jgi:hypothetical protein